MKLTFFLFAFIINFFNPHFSEAAEIIVSPKKLIKKTTKEESAKNEISGLETLIREIAPTPGGDEQATIVSSRSINLVYFLGPCIYICKADTREFMNQ